MASEIENNPLAIRAATPEEMSEIMSPMISENFSELEVPGEEDLSFFEICILLSIIGVSLLGILTGLKLLGWI